MTFCLYSEMAEEVGFEPTVRLRAQRFSRPPRSTAPAPLLDQNITYHRKLGKVYSFC